MEEIVPAGSLTIQGCYGVGCTSRADDDRLTVLNSNGGERFGVNTATSTVVLKTMTFDQAEVVLQGICSLTRVYRAA